MLVERLTPSIPLSNEARACYELHALGAAGSAQRPVRRIDPTPPAGRGKSLPFPCLRGKGLGDRG